MKLSKTLLVALALIVGGAGSGVAFAQASRLGNTFATGIAGNTRWVDIAFDPANRVYLAVAGKGSYIRGVWLSEDGVPIGAAFAVHGATPYAQAPRTTYSAGAGGFLVTWHQTLPSRGEPTAVFGRVIRYVGDWGPVYQISGANTFWEMGAAAAYATGSREFLVAWQDLATRKVFARRLAVTGEPIGGELSFPASFQQRDPGIGYNPATDEFIVGFAGYDNVAAYAAVQRVKAGTGALLGGATQLGSPALSTYIPEIACQGNGQCLVLWYQRSSSSAVYYARVMNADGSFTTAQPIPARTDTASYDSLSVAYSAGAGAYFMVSHSQSAEVGGVEMSTAGQPSAPIVVTGSGGNGNFNPRIAVNDSRPEWLAVASRDFNPVIGQRVTTATRGTGGPPPPPPPPPPPTNPADPTSIDLAGAPNGSEFFAEGYASSDGLGFNTYYQIANDHDVPTTVRAYFARQTSDGSVVLKQREFTVAANSRKTVDLKYEVGDGPWSAVFQSMTAGRPVTTQQSVFWGPNWEGSSTETAAQAVSPVWLFAEGSRTSNDFFSNFFLLFNPGTQPITVLGEYYGPGAANPVVRSYTLPPASRFTVHANNAEIPSLANQDFSVRFRAADGASPFVAQRAMYWSNFAGGHSANGVTAPHARWQFAEGAAAPGFDTYFTLFNPNPFDVEVDVTYLTEAFGPVKRNEPFLLRRNSRGTIYANGEVGPIGGFGTTFQAIGGHGIVVERSIYWGAAGQPWVEGTNDAGVNAGAMTWHVPEGSDSGLFDTYVLVANPNAFDVSVRVQFYLEGGGRITVPNTVLPAGSRVTVDMNAPTARLKSMSPDDAALLRGKSFAVKVTSLTPNGPVIVEEAIYRNWQDSTRWRAGGSAFGVPK